MIPLLAKMSALITVAFPSVDVIVTPSALVTIIGSPPAVSKKVPPFGISPDLSAFGTTCLRRISVSLSLFFGFKRLANVLAGILSKASLFGAKTVNGPVPLRVASNSANVTA